MLWRERFSDRLYEMICCRVAESLFRNAQSMGVKRVLMEIDHATVRIFSAGDWDGSAIGDRKVSGTLPLGCM